jgi:hypothetical protein
MSDKAMRASRNEKVRGEQLKQQEMEQREEGQDDLEKVARDIRSAAQNQQDEDVHGFLRDEHDDIHSRININKP